MNTNPIPRSGATRALIWWILWTGILLGLVVQALMLELQPASVPVHFHLLADFIGIGLLLASSLLRWLVLPRLRQVQSAFVVFVLGLVLAESCGLLGIFLSAHKNELMVLGVLGLGMDATVCARLY